MIFVQEKIEPADFNSKVRSPGNLYLSRIGNNLPNFNNHRYWSTCLGDLSNEYGNICAYTSSWIAVDAGSSVGSVDHYLPKDKFPELAYEWNNYRFCNPRVNANKGNHLDVMDPFRIKDGWFTIDFTTFLIEPASGLPEYLTSAITKTIVRLRLNDDDRLVQSRSDRIKEYASGEISFDYLKRKYPFIAMELERQDLTERIKTRFQKNS